MSSAGCHYGAVEDGRRGAAPDAVALMGSLEVVELHEPVKASIERGPAGEVVPAKDHAPVGDGGTQMPSPKLVQGPTGEVIQFPAGMSDEPGRIAERIGSQAQTALQTAQLIASPSGAEEATKPPPIRVALPPVAGGPGTTYALGLPGHRCGAGPTEGHARRERCHGGTGRASVGHLRRREQHRRPRSPRRCRRVPRSRNPVKSGARPTSRTEDSASIQALTSCRTRRISAEVWAA
jgi:hypothetical protein